MGHYDVISASPSDSHTIDSLLHCFLIYFACALNAAHAIRRAITTKASGIERQSGSWASMTRGRNNADFDIIAAIASFISRDIRQNDATCAYYGATGYLRFSRQASCKLSRYYATAYRLWPHCRYRSAR